MLATGGRCAAGFPPCHAGPMPAANGSRAQRPKNKSSACNERNMLARDHRPLALRGGRERREPPLSSIALAQLNRFGEKRKKETKNGIKGVTRRESTQFALRSEHSIVAAMPACKSEEAQEKLDQCLTSLRCRLRVRCHCAECVAVAKNRDHRAPRGGSKHLAAEMVLKETEDTNQTAGNTANQKVSCVATLPIPAGGFCRRSAAAQLMLAQEMCRQTALDDEPFDCADHDW